MSAKCVRKGVNEKRDVKNHDHAQGNREHRGSHWMSNGPSGCQGCDDPGPDRPPLIMIVLMHGKPVSPRVIQFSQE